MWEIYLYYFFEALPSLGFIIKCSTTIPTILPETLATTS